jgi:hypothetical protein
MPKFTTYLPEEMVKYLREKAYKETKTGKYTSAANIIQRLIAADMVADKKDENNT